MARITINAKVTTPEDLASLIASLGKIDADSLTPGADLKIDSARVQVADVQVSELRAFALRFGFPVGKRGVISKAVKDAFAEYQNAPNKGAAASRARRQAREAVAA